ncbi:MAG: CDP-alcohol phosphatidyltransferase family protein [archaeon]|nr:CDP-alcohol phosphatidyltransferase family protein [archaeon]
MLGSFRPKLKEFTELIATPFARLGVAPNFFSFSGAVLAIVAAYFIYMQDFPSAFIFSLLAVCVDLFDGEVARIQKKDSLWGNYFETIIDKLVETILFIGAAFVFPIAAIFALGLAMLASYAKPRVALVIITDNRDWPGLGEHSDRMLLFVFGLFGQIFFAGAEFISPFELSLYLVALISAVGFVQRALYAKKLISEAQANGSVLPYLKK